MCLCLQFDSLILSRVRAQGGDWGTIALLLILLLLCGVLHSATMWYIICRLGQSPPSTPACCCRCCPLLLLPMLSPPAAADAVPSCCCRCCGLHGF